MSATRALGQRLRFARRRQPLDDGSKSVKAVASARRRTISTCILTISTRKSCTSDCRHFRERAHLRRRRRNEEPIRSCRPSITTWAACRRTTRRGPDQGQRRSDAVVPGPDGARRSGLRLGAWRQSAGLEFADRPRRLRPRRGLAPAELREAGTHADLAGGPRPIFALSRLDRFRDANGKHANRGCDPP